MKKILMLLAALQSITQAAVERILPLGRIVREMGVALGAGEVLVGSDSNRTLPGQMPARLNAG